MTTMTTPWSNESLTTGLPTRNASSTGRLIYRVFSPERPIPLPNTKAAKQVFARLESDPRKAELLAAARKKLAADIYADEPDTFTALRLSAGLSQSELAQKASTQQPYISRIERGTVDPGSQVISKIAEALGVDAGVVVRAVTKQLATRGKS